MGLKNRKINQLKAGVILSYISMGLGYLISIVYTPIMLRLLGQSEYGLYNLVSSVVSYLGLLNFGFGSAYVHYYMKYKAKYDKDNIDRLNGMFLIVFSIIGVVAVLAGTVLVFNVDIIFGDKLTAVELFTSKILMAIMVFNLALSFPASVFNSYITANEQYIFQKVIQMIKTVVSPLVMLPVLLMGYKSIGMVVVTTLLTIIVEISNVRFCFKKLKMKFLFKQFDFALMKEMIVFSSYIFVNMVVDQINWNVDKFIIGRFRGTVGVAVYSLAAQLNTYYMSLSTTISSVFIPRVHKMVAGNNDDRELTRLFTRIGRVQFMLLSLIFLGFIFFGRPFINMWAGSDYDESYAIALILIVPGTISLIQNIGIEIQRAKNMHQFRSWIYLIFAICNVLISIPLTRLYGGVGAAIGTSTAIVIGNGFIMNVYYHVKVGIDIKFFWKQICKIMQAFIAPIIVGILIVLFIDLYHPILFLVCGIIYVIVFCISMWFIGMNNYEKDSIRKPISRIIKQI